MAFPGRFACVDFSSGPGVTPFTDTASSPRGWLSAMIFVANSMLSMQRGFFRGRKLDV